VIVGPVMLGVTKSNDWIELRTKHRLTGEIRNANPALALTGPAILLELAQAARAASGADLHRQRRHPNTLDKSIPENANMKRTSIGTTAIGFALSSAATAGSSDCARWNVLNTGMP
jgi:hypothetical protein